MRLFHQIRAYFTFLKNHALIRNFRFLICKN
nr:MAG TPA: hypothetical protein [Caudoviricetes sp.]